MRAACMTLVLGLAACSHQGTGHGELEHPGPESAGAERQDDTVTFRWQSGADTSEGTISATTADGRRFEGTYLQLTSTTLEPTYTPYYTAWAGPRWGMIGPWYSGPREQFVTHFSGKVMAHLSSQDGTNMRCAFALRDPARGMNGGAQGDCQLSTNEAVFGAQIRGD